MPSPGQHHKDEGREPTLTPAIPGEGVYEVEFKNIRTNVVRLLPNGFQERKLKKLGNTSAKLYNEANYERRQQFFKGRKVDLKTTWNKYYQKYKNALGVNAQATL
ncbi:MAG: RNA-guided endonuclease TnpB family protein, partial [Thermoprotei archaeon]